MLLLYCLILGIYGASTSEIQALDDIYKSLGGSNWKDSKNWLNGDPCENSWYGVKCNSNGNVTSVQLDKNGLKGMIPDSISQLTMLGYLALEWNGEISGPLPDSIGDLSRLFGMTLVNEKLSGALPESIGNLKRLSILHLGSNNFTSLPDTISGMSSLSSFALENNGLDTPLPDDPPPFISDPSKCNFMTDCDLSNNPLPCDPPLPDWATKCCKATCVQL